MKKLLLVCMMVSICLLCSFAYGSSSAKDNAAYSATITNPAGAQYLINGVSGDVVGGTLKKGDVIQIYYECEKEDGTVDLYFITSNETSEAKWQLIKKINKEDITASGSSIKIRELRTSGKVDVRVLSESGLNTYEYPGLGYPVKDVIPVNTSLTVFHVDNFGDNNWYCHKNEKGKIEYFIHMTSRTVGFAPDRKILTPTRVILYQTPELDDSKAIFQIEPNTMMEDYVRVNRDYYYVTIYDRDGYFRFSDIGAESLNGETSTVWYENTNLYSEGNFNSIMLYEDIPTNTVLKWEYNTDLSKYGWIRTTYKNLTGWVFTINPRYVTEDSEEAAKVREEYFRILSAGEGAPINPDKDVVVEIINNTQSGDQNKIVQPENPNEENPNPDVPVVQNPNPVENEEADVITPQLIFVTSCIGTIILLIVIIVVLFKRNKWYRKRIIKGKRKW